MKVTCTWITQVKWLVGICEFIPFHHFIIVILINSRQLCPRYFFSHKIPARPRPNSPSHHRKFYGPKHSPCPVARPIQMQTRPGLDQLCKYSTEHVFIHANNFLQILPIHCLHITWDRMLYLIIALYPFPGTYSFHSRFDDIHDETCLISILWFTSFALQQCTSYVANEK